MQFLQDLSFLRKLHSLFAQATAALGNPSSALNLDGSPLENKQRNKSDDHGEDQQQDEEDAMREDERKKKKKRKKDKKDKKRREEERE